MTNEMIEKLEEAGAKRWTKYGKDRLYIDVELVLDLDVDRYNTGNICKSLLDGEKISHARASRILGSKIYIDLTTDELVVAANSDEKEMIEEAAKKFVTDATAEEEETTEDSAEEEKEMELTASTLMKSIYDADMDEMTLIFQTDGGRVFARGKAPEGSFTDERYFDSDESIRSFLEDADVEREEEI